MSSAEVWVNGKKVLGENDFNQKVESLRKPLRLQTDNYLKCILRGKPGGAFNLKVLSKDIIQPPTVEILSPADGSFLSQSSVNVSWQINGIDQT